jgi:hypothetical protein
MHQIHWPFGTDDKCAARIHPGSPNFPTPDTLAYPSFTLRKHPGQDKNPNLGWYEVDRKAYEILSQERHPQSGLPIVQFTHSPLQPTRQSQALAAKKKTVRGAIDPEFFAEAVASGVRQVLQEMGIKGPVPVAPEPPAPAVTPLVDPPGETPGVKVVGTEEETSEEGVEGGEPASKEDPPPPEDPKGEAPTETPKGTRRLRLRKG